MINDILSAFYMTIELWVFLGILAVATVAGDLIEKNRQKLVDNPALK
jgi:hypothetical protein